MNRQEILEYINYQGKYTKEVKTKINKLLKKYHPDTNKEDKKTILVIYEIKKELEEGKELDYNKETKKEKKETNTVNTIFIERIINILKQRKKFIRKELNNLYKRSYYYTNKIYEESYDKGLIDIKIEELNNNITFIKKVDNIEILIILIIIIIMITTIISKKIYLLLFIIIPIIFEKYYLNSKKIYIEDTKIIIDKLKSKKKEFLDREEKYNKNIKEIRNYEIRLEQEIRTISNDISYYSNELSKSKNIENEYSKEHENSVKYKKTK